MENLCNRVYKPRNNGVNFLVYGTSNCRRFREATFDELTNLAFVSGMKVHDNGKCWSLMHNDD